MPIITGGRGNTRLNPKREIHVHPDYLRIKRDAMPMGDFLMLLDFVGQKYSTEIDRFWSPGGYGVRYDNKLTGIDGFVGGFTVDENGFVACMLDLSGAYFSMKTAVDSWLLLRGLHYCYQMKCTRIDLAIDDYTFWIVPVIEMRDGWERGEGFGFKKYKFITSGEDPDDMQDTDYFGSKESGKMVRVYTHGKDRLRFEAEFKRAYAHPIFMELATMERPEDDGSLYPYGTVQEKSLTRNDCWDMDLQKAMASYAVGAVDFRDRGTRKDRMRAGRRDSERCSYYQQFIDKVTTTSNRIRLPKEERSIRKVVQWIERQVVPSLAMVREGLGRHRFTIWMHEQLDKGEIRMDKSKQLWVLEIRERPQLVCNW